MNHSTDIANLFADIPAQLPQELSTRLLDAKNLRIERIVSYGHASEPDFWYQQEEHEWVILLTGGALLRWASGREEALAPGDYVFIPAGEKHRVEGTLADEHSVWLAVFFAA
ncbi:cupin domain-containing protein [Gilvimarinus sp. DA14]|uniref:cupin domain-containing protein n=1 Tax=Gilvimarinus sp. DA14 TaxID=2956798 RepID=UPI0020B83560|nr:cupin domain-containing protein [Gilvimarinus sp. DA14]UTF58699.1 cupin domain-containing protein [Gilvimarinus sp. DA14]